METEATPEFDIPNALEGMRDPPAKNNLMEALRQKTKSLDEPVFLQLAVPGYDDCLVVRYNNTLTWGEINRTMKKLEKNKNEMAQLFAQCDMLIEVTDSIWARADAEDELQRLETDDGTFRPMLWTPELAEFLGFPGMRNARESIRAVFRSDIRLGATQGRVMQWIQQIDENSGEEVTGES